MAPPKVTPSLLATKPPADALLAVMALLTLAMPMFDTKAVASLRTFSGVATTSPRK